LLLMCSDAEQYLQKTWAYWFEAMPFWSTPDAITCFGDGEQGEVTADVQRCRAISAKDMGLLV
ncbi:hypothetical protein VPH49_23915, partial [Pseudomonas luteola]|uniref:hypothetical protein n=1 Tax=Pseudomonas luteola TaxID=47886 RepID=UPI003A8B1B92